MIGWIGVTGLVGVLISGLIVVALPSTPSPPPPRSSLPRTPIRIVHNFGTTISDGSPLRHVFRIKNPSDQSFRILEATASSPCCSGIEPLPDIVPGGDWLSIPVFIRTAGRTGPQQVMFAIGTDSPAMPTILCVALADLVEGFDLEPLDRKNDLVVGRPMKMVYRAIHRRVADVLEAAPTSVSIPPPFQVAFISPARERIGPDHLIEWQRDLAIEIPAPEDMGRLATTLRFDGADGPVASRSLSWEVHPPLRAMPNALVINASDGVVERHIDLRSQDLPFSIHDVEGSIIVDHRVDEPLVIEGQATCRLTLRLDGTRASERSNAVRIATDHRIVPELRIPVLVLP
ncbi:DUF1573 domain-containing protein [Tautonia sociabilis]|uniref:DUF1573 domain-containing protein n=1 Tax=Tautonia sociabilis TaxID=2080755 RepID=UPI00131515AB|nr:DUF1573 domain-containing protein [Tautonia sociabilis]